MTHRTVVRTPALLLVSAVVLLLAAPVEASQAFSWNLSRDLLTGGSSNANGPWSFVYSQPTAVGAPMVAPFAPPSLLQWSAAPCFAWVNCWQDPSNSNALVGFSTQTGTNGLDFVWGVPVLHPGFDRRTAVRWKNLTGQTLDLQILGRVTDLDPVDDGVDFAVIKTITGTTLASGTVQSTAASPRDGRAFYAATTVGPNQEIYFIIDRRNLYFFDTTELDVLLTGTVHCFTPCTPL
jgi:hypothetical protein